MKEDQKPNRGGFRKHYDNRGSVKFDMIIANRTSCTRTGGRIQSFQSTVLAYDANGKIGIATKKAKMMSDAKRKAEDRAMRSLKFFKYSGKKTLLYDVNMKQGSTRLLVKRCTSGITKGSTNLQKIANAIGISVQCKARGSKSNIVLCNMLYNAIFKAETLNDVAKRRGISAERLKEHQYMLNNIEKIVAEKENIC